MSCCHCQTIEKLFSDKTAAKDLRKYRKRGPDKSTRILLDALHNIGVHNQQLLDIGGGVGVVAHELLPAGARHATLVEASSAYLAAAREEAERRGHADRLGTAHGDFVELADTVDPADLVTLDRVVCCYPDVQNLVKRSAAKARRAYGLVYPRDVWWMKLGVDVQNLLFTLFGNPFRLFVHPAATVESLVRGAGFQEHFRQETRLWRVEVYVRVLKC